MGLRWGHALKRMTTWFAPPREPRGASARHRAELRRRRSRNSRCPPLAAQHHGAEQEGVAFVVGQGSPLEVPLELEHRSAHPEGPEHESPHHIATATGADASAVLVVPEAPTHWQGIGARGAAVHPHDQSEHGEDAAQAQRIKVARHDRLRLQPHRPPSKSSPSERRTVEAIPKPLPLCSSVANEGLRRSLFRREAKRERRPSAGSMGFELGSVEFQKKGKPGIIPASHLGRVEKLGTPTLWLERTAGVVAGFAVIASIAAAPSA